MPLIACIQSPIYIQQQLIACKCILFLSLHYQDFFKRKQEIATVGPYKSQVPCFKNNTQYQPSNFNTFLVINQHYINTFLVINQPNLNTFFMIILQNLYTFLEINYMSYQHFNSYLFFIMQRQHSFYTDNRFASHNAEDKYDLTVSKQ